MSDRVGRAVTVLISRRVKLGAEADFERLCGHLMAVAATFTGYLGAQLVHPGEDADVYDGLYHVVLAFDSNENLDHWKKSPARSLGLEAIEPYIEGPPLLRDVSGLAYWYQPTAGANVTPPPRWKVAVVTWLGICPIVYLSFLVFGDYLAKLPLLPRTISLTLFVVAMMTWFVAPFLTKTLKSWLK